MSETYKTPAEVYPITVDFDLLLPSGVTVDAGNVRGDSAVKAFDGATEVTDTLVVTGSTTTSGTQLQAWVTAGTANKTYRLEFTAATSDVRILVHNVRLYVAPT